MSDSLKDLILTASTRADVIAAVQQIYTDLQIAIDTRRPLCSASGECCRFDAYGHRLYVTTLELATFVAQLPPPAKPKTSSLTPSTSSGLALHPSSLPHNDCPYLVAGRCSVHLIRPFGCRIFFCDPTATQWQNDLYEATLQRLKDEHERLAVPYRYVEWRAALKELGLPDIKEVSANPNAFDSPRVRSLHLPQAR